jgi:MYXO-CTERM domain-containing protein
VVVAASLAVPDHGTLKLGIAEALGCTGGGPGTGVTEQRWQRLAPTTQPGAVTALATDGFLPLRGLYTGLSVEEALASINLIVTDETGKKLPGSIKAFGGPNRQVFGWTATEPLAIGQHLTAFVSVASMFDPLSNLTQTYALQVVGPPEALPEPSAVFYGWTDTYKGVGPMALCQVAVSSCGGPTMREVSSNFEATGHAVELFSKVAPQSGVAWEISLASPAGSPESTSYSSYPVVVTSAYEGAQVFGEIAFTLTTAEVCAVVITKDLRTGAEVRGDVCGVPQPAVRIKTDGLSLSACSEPPSAAARDLWCEARKKDSQSCDLPAANPNEPTVPAANPSEPTVPGPVVSDPMNADASDSDRGPATSKGCQLGGSGSPGSGGAWALSLAALGVAAARRRRYRA